MYIVTKYEIPIDDYRVIPEGTRMKVCNEWNEYSGFIAAEYKGERYYFNSSYFLEIECFAEVI